MKPVKAIDAAFLQLETASTPMHVGALFVLEPPSPRQSRSFFARFRTEIGRRLGRSEVFTRRVAALPFNVANPMWVTAGDVDLDFHVRRTELPPPGTRHQLEECVADLHAPCMDRRRPLWELHVIEGLEGGRLALYVKTHHAGLDGASAQLFLQAFCDAGRPQRVTSRRATRPPRGEDPSDRELLAAGVRHQVQELGRLPRTLTRLDITAAGAVRGLRDALATVGHGVPRTPLNVSIDAARSFASVECELAAVKSVAKAHEVTVNDVVLAACSGTLRRWLALHGSLPVQTLRAAIPFSTRESGNLDHSIQVSFMFVALHTDIADAHARLAAIHESTQAAKGAAARVKSLVPEDLPSVGLPWLLGGMARFVAAADLIQRVPLPMNVIISNVAGPTVPLFVAGARATTYTPVSIPYHGCALNITVYSYDGKLFFGLTAARSAVPDLRDLADGIREEIVLLRAARWRPRDPSR